MELFTFNFAYIMYLYIPYILIDTQGPVMWSSLSVVMDQWPWGWWLRSGKVPGRRNCPWCHACQKTALASVSSSSPPLRPWFAWGGMLQTCFIMCYHHWFILYIFFFNDFSILFSFLCLLFCWCQIGVMLNQFDTPGRLVRGKLKNFIAMPAAVAASIRSMPC